MDFEQPQPQALINRPGQYAPGSIRALKSRLTRGLLGLLLPLATLLGLTLLALLRSRFSLTLGRLACGPSFLAALRLALLLSLRGLS